MKMRGLIPVHLCCNGASGMPDGCGLRQIQIGDDSPMELEAMWWDEEKGDFCGPDFEYHFQIHPDWSKRGWGAMPCRGQFQIQKQRFPFVAWRSHVGNICWDMAIMPLNQCVRMLRWLRRHELFSCTCAPCALYDLWESKREITPSLLLETI